MTEQVAETLPELAAILTESARPDQALRLLNEILNTLPVAISLYDASDEDFCVLYLNPAVESFAGPVKAPVARRPALEVYPEALQNRVIELFKKTLAEGSQHLRDFVSHTGRHFDVDSYNVEGPHAKPYLLLVAQEITDLISANLAKAQFMNMAAHELRTPLSVIKGYLSMLGEGTFGAPPDAWRPQLEIINAKTVELDQLVDSVLTAARLDGSNVTPRPQVHDLRKLVGEAVQRARARARLLDAELHVEGLEGPPLYVRISQDHAHRIIDNLVNNALTYSPAPAWVRVNVEAFDEGSRVVVEDRGRGIAEHEQHRIFDQFARVEDPEFGYPPGSGLGLYISRRLAQMYGGDVELRDSELGRGSVFVMRLPAVARPGAGES